MKALIYEGLYNNNQIFCAAYENDSEFINIFYDKNNLYHLLWQQGQVYYASKTNNVRENIISQFKATNITTSKNDVGKVIQHVWRPGLNVDLPRALCVENSEKARAKKELQILISRLDDILLFIEPTQANLAVYGHKIRELLILSCTELESSWLAYLKLSDPHKDWSRANTNDFIKLKEKLFLHEYKITFTNYPFQMAYKPFENWQSDAPTQSLTWYNAYNKTKHDKAANFNEGNLENCLLAIMANIIMYCVRYSPYDIIENRDIFANLMNERFEIELENPDMSSFYIPSIKSFETATGAFSAPLASGFYKEWCILEFIL